MSGVITRPLATKFTPPASCRTHFTYEAPLYNGDPNGLLVQNALPNFLDTSCFPDGFDQYGRTIHGTFVYSPGACPVGYSLETVPSDQTTTAVCCPFSYFLHTTTSNDPETSASSKVLEGCTSVFRASIPTTVPAVSGANATNTTVVTGPITAWAQPITIQYQPSDLTLFTTTSAAKCTILGCPVSSRTTGFTFLPWPSFTQVADSTSDYSGLTAGSGIGIALGSCAGFLFLCMLIQLCRRYQIEQSNTIALNTLPPPRRLELPDDPRLSHQHELDEQPPTYAEAVPGTQELPVNPERIELSDQEASAQRYFRGMTTRNMAYELPTYTRNPEGTAAGLP